MQRFCWVLFLFFLLNRSSTPKQEGMATHLTVVCVALFVHRILMTPTLPCQKSVPCSPKSHCHRWVCWFSLDFWFSMLGRHHPELLHHHPTMFTRYRAETVFGRRWQSLPKNDVKPLAESTILASKPTQTRECSSVLGKQCCNYHEISIKNLYHKRSKLADNEPW